MQYRMQPQSTEFNFRGVTPSRQKLQLEAEISPTSSKTSTGSSGSRKK
jgi:hypothetical protein